MTRQSSYGKGLIAIALLSFLVTPALAAETVTSPDAPLQTVNDGENNSTGSGPHLNSLAPTGSSGGKSGSLSGNSVTLDSGAVGGVFGAVNLMTPDALTGNKVVINGGSASSFVSGAIHYINSGAATATGNSVVVNGGTIEGNVIGARGGVAGATGSVTFTGNSVIVNGGNVADVSTPPRFDGAFIYVPDANFQGTITATGNSVSINGGDVSAEALTGSYIYSGSAANSGAAVSASNNSVSITGGDVTIDQVFGARVNVASGAATASNNSVLLQTGTVSDYVLGGVVGTDDGLATATGNSITIHKVPGKSLDLSTAVIAGGFNTGSAKANIDTFTGNTLNVQNDTNETITVKTVGNVENYNFIVSSNQGSTPVLTVTDTLYLDDSYQNNGTGRSATISASTVGGAPLAPGSNVQLFDATTVSAAAFDATQVIQGRHGAVLNYRSTLNPTTGVLTMDGAEANPQAKALSEGWLGGLALTTQGADLVAGQGMGNAVGAAYGAGGNGFGAFAALSGGWSRYNTGSHMDMNSVSLMTGLAWGVDTTPGHLTLGAFFEFGTGSYDTSNSFSNAASVNGDGDTYYTGGGILGRMDFQNTGPGRFYTEASARMGKVHNEYENSDLRDPLGRNADYDSSSLYYGLHLGTGYVWNITEKASLDLYGKYFWTRQEGDSVTLSTDDPVRFKDADSHRLRGGARFAYAVNEYVSPYIGAAYEHEFDGKARASTYGYSIDAPSLRGDTGIGEIGLTLKPSATLPLSFDLGVQGYTGQREGVTGSLQAKFEF